MNFKEFLFEKSEDVVSTIAKKHKGKIEYDDPKAKLTEIITFKQASDANKALDDLLAKDEKAGLDATTKISF